MHSFAAALSLSCFALVSALPAQLIPKNLETRRPAVSTRPSGAWTGTASESLPDGRKLEYALKLKFTGADDALQLDVAAETPVATEGGGKVTVSIRATYRGRFTTPDLRMRSERIEVRILESNEQVPSQPQAVEATLVDGVLRGRVGSDEDGWTSFTARPEGGNSRVDEVKVADAGLVGVWSGTCRERGPDGAEMSYPIRVEFVEQAGALRAEVAADLRYPTENGSTPVEYRASFRGTRNAEGFELASDKVQIRLVEMQRTENGPRQRLTGRMVDGVLRARIGGDGGEASELELRREGRAPKPGGERGNDERVRDERIGDERVTDERTTEERNAEGPVRNAPARRGAALSQDYRTVQLASREVRDAESGNVVSHTVLLPRGWEVRGGPQWRLNPSSFVNFVAEIRGTADESVTFVAEHAFHYSGTQSQFGRQDSPDEAWSPGGEAKHRPPQNPGDVATTVLLPFLRPGATDVQLVDAGQRPDLEQVTREALKVQLDGMEALAAQVRRNTNVEAQSNPWFACERSRVCYREGGREWEEEVQCTLIGQHYSSQAVGIMTASGFWTVHQIRTFRAPAGQLDARLPLLTIVADSVRETPRWSLAVAELRLELSKGRTRELANQTAAMAAEIGRRVGAMSRLGDEQMASWKRQQDSIDRCYKANLQALGEVQDFRAADGDVHTVTNHYDRAFRDRNDNLILTNDPNYRPAGDPMVNRVEWEEMQRIDPFRRG